MLVYLIIVLLGLWTFGLLTQNLFDGYIHLLLFVVLAAFFIRYFTNKKLLD